MTTQSLVGFCVVFIDGIIALANGKFADLIGHHGRNLTGRQLLELIPPQERKRVAGHLRARSAGANGMNRYTTLAIRSDGPARRIVVQTCRIIYDGRPASLVFTYDLKERQLELNEQIASVIIEQSPVVIFQTSAKKGFPREFVSNNVTRFGYTAEEAKSGMFTFPDFVHPDDRPEVDAALHRMVEQDEDLFERDYRVITRDGSVGWVSDRTVTVRDEKGKAKAYRGALIDITERRIAELDLLRANRALRVSSETNALLFRASSETDMLQQICELLVAVGKYRAAWVGYAEQDAATTVRVAAQSGDERDSTGGPDITCDDTTRSRSVTSRAIRTSRTQIDQDASTEPGVSRRDGCQHLGYSSSAAMPLLNGTTAFGAITVVSTEANPFDKQELMLLEELAGNVARGISSMRLRADHDRLQWQLKRSLNDTVRALADVLELRDPYTAGHQRHVAALAEKIAVALGLPDREIEGIVLAASLHDIGKLQVPSEILSKPGKLTVPELHLVQCHAKAGYDILKGVDFPWPVAELVLQHHERLDGSGYPNGLKDDSIALGAKIIAVADVFESMTTHRPFRPALSLDAAIAELENGRGTLYHPPAVDACVALVRESGTALFGQEPLMPPPDGPPVAAKSKSPPDAVRAPARLLTLQQSAVMQLLGQGYSTKAIARHLNLSPSTVKVHLSHAYAALGAHNRVEAVVRSGGLEEIRLRQSPAAN